MRRKRKITYDPKRDYYTIQGVEMDGSAEQIRDAYRRKVRAAHPDLNPDRKDWATAQLQLLNEAYDVLGDAKHRKQYDRRRWPHVPSQPQPARTPYQSPFRAPTYDPDRPWWEQATPYTSPRGPFAADPTRRSPSSSGLARPPWLKVAVWLREHRLGALESTWLTLVGLWRSPYAGILAILSVLLALNVAFITYAFIAPEYNDGWVDDVRAWFSRGAESVNGEASPTAHTSSPDRLYESCTNEVRISSPGSQDHVAGVFSVYGTVQDSQMWNYWVEVGYIGRTYTPSSLPSGWRTVRTPDPEQNHAEDAVENGLLVERVDLGRQATGFYVVRLHVTRLDDYLLAPCDVVVQYK